MAKKTVDQLQKEFDRVSSETQKAYDVLHPTFGSDARQIAYEYEKAVKENDKKVIRELKPLYEKAQAAYKDAQTRKNALRKQLEAAKKEEEESKKTSIEQKSATNAYEKALDKLAIADASLGVAYQGDQKYIDAYQSAKLAYDAAVKSGKNPRPLPEPKIAIPVAEGQDEQGTAKGGAVVTGPSTYTEALTFLTDSKNKESLIRAQKALSRFGYKGNTKGEPDATFTSALTRAAEEYSSLPVNWRSGSLLDYIVNPVAGGAGAGAGTGTGGSQYDPYATLSVWDKVKTKAELNTLYQSLLDRDATPEEVDAAYNKLQQKQKEQKATVTKYKVINGVRTAVTTPGFNQGEYLTDLVKGTKEYKNSVKKKETEKTSAAEITKQDLMKTAMANGISLTPEQLTDFQARIDAGEKTDAIKNTIRQIASLGLPDHVKQIVASGVDLATVYAPYKTALAQTLEVNPASITLDDPTLRMAIGPDKEMSLYEYQRALRKDNRWQYTDQAKQEASDVAKTVLRDFGFMG